MAIKFTKHQPKSGTFSVVWEFEGQVWSSTFSSRRGLWYKYYCDDNGDSWTRVESPYHHIPSSNPKVTGIKYAVIREG